MQKYLNQSDFFIYLMLSQNYSSQSYECLMDKNWLITKESSKIAAPKCQSSYHYYLFKFAIIGENWCELAHRNGYY